MYKLFTTIFPHWNNKNTTQSLVSGITIIEILIIISIIGTMSLITFSSLSSYRDEQNINNTAVDIVSLLNKARSNTLSSLNSTNYSVHFETTKVVLFVGAIYSASAVTNEPLVFHPAVKILPTGGINVGGGSVVTYERLTGDTIGGTIVLTLVSKESRQKIITINKTGIVSTN